MELRRQEPGGAAHDDRAERAAEEGAAHTYTMCWAGVMIFPGSQVDTPEGHLDPSHHGSVPPKTVSRVDKEISTQEEERTQSKRVCDGERVKDQADPSPAGSQVRPEQGTGDALT